MKVAPECVYVHKGGLCCSWRCLHQRGQSCIWGCLHYRGLCYFWRCWDCAASGGVYATGAWAAFRHVYTTQACAALGGVFTTEAWAAFWRIYTILHAEACAAPVCVYTEMGKLHLYVSTTEACVAHLGVSGLCCISRFLHPVGWAAPGLGWTTGACAAPGRVYNTGVWAALEPI